MLKKEGMNLEIHERLQQMLDNCGWSAYQLAKGCGLSESVLSNILSNKTTPSLKTLHAICDGFGITLSQFFAEDNLVELTDEQLELFHKWVTLTPRQKAAISYVIETFQSKF